MRILITAFDPFGGLDTNSSMMTLEKIKDNVEESEIIKLVIPTVYEKSAAIVEEKAKLVGADCILCLGQAGGRRNVSVEVIAINYALSELGDNQGTVYKGEKLTTDGEAAYFATVPVKAMVEKAREAGFEASLSTSAGAFVCNSLLYLLLKKSPAAKIGFIHLPYATEQQKGEASMSADLMAKCVEEMIKAINNSERI